MQRCFPPQLPPLLRSRRRGVGGAEDRVHAPGGPRVRHEDAPDARLLRERDLPLRLQWRAPLERRCPGLEDALCGVLRRGGDLR
eukprot:8249924-Pyramimonas_sp.AAC.1